MNKAFFMGNFTRDPEVKTLPSGSVVVDFSIAVNEFRKGKDGGEPIRYATFVDFQAWDALAERIAKYFTKGRKILIDDCKYVKDTWETPEGQKRSRGYFRVNHFEFVDKAPESENEAEPVSAGAVTEDPPF